MEERPLPASFTAEMLSAPEEPDGVVMAGLREVCRGVPGVTEAYLVRFAVSHGEDLAGERIGLRLVTSPLPVGPPSEDDQELVEGLAAVHRATVDLGYPVGEVGYVAEAGLRVIRKRGLRVL